MEPFFTEEQLNGMSRENLIELMKLMKEQSAKKDTEIQLLKDKQKEAAAKPPVKDAAEKAAKSKGREVL